MDRPSGGMGSRVDWPPAVPQSLQGQEFDYDEGRE